jgi:SAM-dependent methyltransferase
MERFAAECLLPPSIVSTGKEDPQARQIREMLESLGPRLRVLDYGAGTGRLLEALRESPIFSTLSYLAVEREPGARAIVEQRVAEIYPAEPVPVFAGLESLRTSVNRNSLDVVILCNTLHEIEVWNWRDLFHDLREILKPNGYVLIVEDMHMPHGEHAHEHGFILLDTEEFQLLFAVDREDHSQFRYAGTERLRAHLVRADALGKISTGTIEQALDRVIRNAEDKVQTLRKNPDYASGQRLALLAMLNMNARLTWRRMSFGHRD